MEAMSLTERKNNIMQKFTHSGWSIFIISIIASVISFYALTNWRLSTIETKQNNYDTKQETYTKENNDKFTQILTKLANIEGKLSVTRKE